MRNKEKESNYFFLTMLRALLFVLVTTGYSSAQFKPNSIGVAYFDGETKDVYYFTVVFPTEALENSERYLHGEEGQRDTINFNGVLTFFNAKGIIYSYLQVTTRNNQRFNSSKIIMQPWPDGMGGHVLKPTVRVRFTKENWWRRVELNPKIKYHDIQKKDYTCFVLINRKPPFKSESLDLPPYASIRLQGDHNSDKKVDCILWSCYDEAENCKESTRGHLDFHLRMNGKDYPFLNLPLDGDKYSIVKK